MDLIKDTVKAGAYVLHEGRFVFMFGYNQARDRLNVVRLGGHREKGGTPVGCAIREVMEESRLDGTVFDAPLTFFETQERRSIIKEPLAKPRPVLIRQQDGAEAGRWTVMYLTHATGALRPSMETQGLLCVDREQLKLLSSGGATIAAMRSSGATILFSVALPEDELMRPTAQVLFLNWLLTEKADCFDSFLRAR